MEHITNLFGQYKLPPLKRSTERGEYLVYFTEEINKERIATKQKPFQLRYIGFRLGHLKKIADLHYLKSICDDTKRRGGIFSKTFFGAIK
ncbi:MAG: hypothetical protein PHN89_04810 [Candidatus Pacebacteria bacterium]|nr:hypothetical protein [Candidatus Paceibacterota bacterium]